MAPKTEISEIRKEELTQAALKCTARKGYDRVTLDDVTKEAGLSKGIASYYFKNRDELLISIIHKMWRNLSAYSREIWNLPDQTDDPEEIYTYVREYYSNPRTDLIAMIKGGIRILISAYDDNPNIWRVIAEFWCQIPRNKMITELNNSMQGFSDAHDSHHHRGRHKTRDLQEEEPRGCRLHSYVHYSRICFQPLRQQGES